MTLGSLPAALREPLVDDEVFDLRPDYHALLIVAEGLRGGPTDVASDAALADAEERAQPLLMERPLDEVPQILEWRDAYRSFGVKPRQARSSVESLIRRAAGGLPRIDRLTDLYNAVSVERLLPIGGEEPRRLRRGFSARPRHQFVCRPEILDDPEDKAALLRDQLAHIQPEGGHAPVETDEPPYARMLPGIRGLRLHILEVLAKFKYDDHNPVDHQVRVSAALDERGALHDTGAATQQRRRLELRGEWRGR